MSARKPIYGPEDEQQLMTQIWSPSIADNPEHFVLFMFPWGVKDTPLEHFAGPRVWQRRALRALAEKVKQNKTAEGVYEALRIAKVSGRGIGKSAFVAWLVLWMMSTRIGSTVTVSANTEAQLRTITWGELAKWVTLSLNAHWWEMSATKLVPAAWLTDLVERDLKIGTRYWAAEGRLWSEDNPDAYAGTHNMLGMLLIFDEASGIPDAIWSIAAGFFTENIPDRYWFAFGNGRRNEGYFFECFGAKRDLWETEQIDARTVEGTDKKIYEDIITEYGADSTEARVEVYGEFPQEGEQQFIAPLLVDNAAQRERWNDMDSPVVIGVDPARGGADATVIAVRRGRDLVDLRRFRGDDTMTVVGHVIDAIEAWRPKLTVIDEGGLGYGILDRLKEQNYRVRGVNFGWKSNKPAAWGNKRAEIWGGLRDWLRTASIPEDRLLRTDLIGPLRKPNSAGVIFLETKKEMRARGLASPDAADALAVTFAYPVYHTASIVPSSKIHHTRFHNPATHWMGS